MARFAVQPPSHATKARKLATPLVVRTSHPTTINDDGDVEYMTNGYMFAMAALVNQAGNVMEMGTLGGGVTANPYAFDDGNMTDSTSGSSNSDEYVIIWPNLTIKAKGKYKIRVDVYWVDDDAGAGQPRWLDTTISSTVDVGDSDSTANLCECYY